MVSAASAIPGSWRRAGLRRSESQMRANAPRAPEGTAMTKAVNRPYNTNQGTGHHAGAPLPKS